MESGKGGDGNSLTDHASPASTVKRGRKRKQRFCSPRRSPEISIQDSESPLSTPPAYTVCEKKRKGPTAQCTTPNQESMMDAVQCATPSNQPLSQEIQGPIVAPSGEHKGPELLEDARHQGLESNAEKCVYESEEPLLTTQNTDNTEQSTDSSGELSGSKHPLYAVKVSTEDHINSHRQEQSTKVAKTISHNAMNNSENAFHYHNDNANISGLPSNGQFVFRDGQYISRDLQANVPREHGQMIFSGRLRDSCSSTSLQDEHLGAAEVMARMNCLEKDDDLLSVGDPPDHSTKDDQSLRERRDSESRSDNAAKLIENSLGGKQHSETGSGFSESNPGTRETGLNTQIVNGYANIENARVDLNNFQSTALGADRDNQRAEMSAQHSHFHGAILNGQMNRRSEMEDTSSSIGQKGTILSNLLEGRDQESLLAAELLTRLDRDIHLSEIQPTISLDHAPSKEYGEHGTGHIYHPNALATNLEHHHRIQGSSIVGQPYSRTEHPGMFNGRDPQAAMVPMHQAPHYGNVENRHFQGMPNFQTNNYMNLPVGASDSMIQHQHSSTAVGSPSIQGQGHLGNLSTSDPLVPGFGDFVNFSRSSQSSDDQAQYFQPIRSRSQGPEGLTTSTKEQHRSKSAKTTHDPPYVDVVNNYLCRQNQVPYEHALHQLQAKDVDPDRFFLILSPEVNADDVRDIGHKGLIAKYIDYLIVENEQITEMSKSVSIPIEHCVMDDPYLMDIIRVKIPFPTMKYYQWLRTYYPNIQIDWRALNQQMLQFQPMGDCRPHHYIVDKRPAPVLLGESFYFFQRERDRLLPC